VGCLWLHEHVKDTNILIDIHLDETNAIDTRGLVGHTSAVIITVIITLDVKVNKLNEINCEKIRYVLDYQSFF
jgi:hypothetical protein